jgi:hypothetical protein
MGVLAACAAAVPVIWLSWALEAQRTSSPFIQAGLAMVAVLAAAGALLVARSVFLRQSFLALRWTGAEWQLVDHTAARHVAVAHPRVCLDFGHALLLRGGAVPAGWPVWWPLTRATAPVAWHALRVALAAAPGVAAGATQPGTITP